MIPRTTHLAIGVVTRHVADVPATTVEAELRHELAGLVREMGLGHLLRMRGAE